MLATIGLPAHLRLAAKVEICLSGIAHRPAAVPRLQGCDGLALLLGHWPFHWTRATRQVAAKLWSIGVEIDVTGIQISSWFQDSFKSDPLSQIGDETIAGLIQSDQANQMDIPACAVFTFDAKYCVQQLAIYLDRYRMMDQLAPKGWSKIRLPKKTHPGAVRVGELGPTAGRRITITIED